MKMALAIYRYDMYVYLKFIHVFSEIFMSVKLLSYGPRGKCKVIKTELKLEGI